MKYLKTTFFGVFLISYFSTLLQGQQQFSLDEAIQYAIDNSNEMRLRQLEVKDAEYQIKEVKAFGIPQLSGGINYNYFIKTPTQPTVDFLTPAIYGILFQENVVEPRDLGEPAIFEFSFSRKNQLSGFLDFSALLFDGSFLQGLKAAKLFKELAASQASITKRNIKSNVTKAYLAVLVAERNIRIVQKNIENVQKSLNDINAMYSQGFVEQLDVDRLELSMEELNTEYEKLARLIDLSYNVLKYQMTFPLQHQIIATDKLDETIDQMMIDSEAIIAEIDYENRPEYEVIKRGIELDRVDVKRLKNGYLPSLKAFANASQSLQRDKLFDSAESGLIPGVSVGLGLTVPIFDGNEKKAQIQRAKIRIDKKELEKKEFERGMELEVINALISISNNKKSLVNQKRSLALNEEIFRKTKIKFNEGIGSSVEVSQAEASLYQSQSKYINTLYDLILSKTDLDIALGRLK